MEVCGASISDGRATYLVVVVIVCVAFLVLWALAAWIAGRGHRRVVEEPRWRSRVEREANDD